MDKNIELADRINHLLSEGAEIQTHNACPIRAAVAEKEGLMVFVRFHAANPFFHVNYYPMHNQKLFLIKKDDTLELLYVPEKTDTEEMKELIDKINEEQEVLAQYRKR